MTSLDDSSLDANGRYCMYIAGCVAAAGGGAWPSGERVVDGENGNEEDWNESDVTLRLLEFEVDCRCIGNGNDVVGSATG